MIVQRTQVPLRSVDFEVRGKVTGVGFRAYTQEIAKKNRVFGYVKNASTGVVVGTLQGPMDKVEIIKRWLRYTGSPDSEISECKFTNEKEITQLEFPNFVIRR